MKDERETKEKLLQSARAEFLAKGYQGASLRSICKASGVTTGALYFFFKDKDDLFTSLVAPQLNTLKAMLTEHMRQELLVLDSGEDAAENDFRDDAYASQQVLHLLYQNYDLFLLLLTGSYGSSLEHFVDELVAISEEHYRKLADRQAALLGVTPPQNHTIHWLAHMQIDAFVHLLTHEPDEQKALAHLQDILQYMLSGWNGLFQPPVSPGP